MKNKRLRNALLVLLLLAVVCGIIIGAFELFLGYFDRCDHRTFTAHILVNTGYSTTTGLYTGSGVYVYPIEDENQPITFSTPFPFKVGDYIDQCIDLNLHAVDIHTDDARY